ncbi:hypothetical protein, partial [Nostoc sp.]
RVASPLGEGNPQDRVFHHQCHKRKPFLIGICRKRTLLFSSLREAAPTRGFSFRDANANANDFAQGKRFGSWEPGLPPALGGNVRPKKLRSN